MIGFPSKITLGAFGQRMRGWLVRIWNDRPVPLLQVHIAGSESLVLSPHMATSLFRIGQESVTNALKYAQAGCITITLTAVDNYIYFSIKDDGKGFDTQQASQGYGLLNMQRRVEELYGTFSLTSSSEGTIINAKLPITA